MPLQQHVEKILNMVIINTDNLEKININAFKIVREFQSNMLIVEIIEDI